MLDPAKLRKQAEAIYIAAEKPAADDISATLRECAELLERSPKLTNEVVHTAYKVHWSSREKAIGAMREALEAVWPLGPNNR